MLQKKKAMVEQTTELLKKKKNSRFNWQLGSDLSSLQKRAGEVEKELHAANGELRDHQCKILDYELEQEEAILMKQCLSDMLMMCMDSSRERQRDVLKNSLKRESSSGSSNS